MTEDSWPHYPMPIVGNDVHVVSLGTGLDGVVCHAATVTEVLDDGHVHLTVHMPGLTRYEWRVPYDVTASRIKTWHLSGPDCRGR